MEPRDSTTQPAEHHAAAVFAREADEIRRARHLVRSCLDSWGLSQQIPALELAVSELVTNALVHGAGDIEVDLSADDRVVRLAVADQGGTDAPHIDRRADAGGTGGWGLRLVDQLADEWGTRGGSAGTHVWMERNTARRSGPV